MDEFEQLLYETRFSTRETAKRMQVNYSDEELMTLMNKPLIERQTLIQKYSQIDLSDEELMKQELSEYMSTIISLINQEYGNFIPNDRLDKLNNMINNDGIIVINDSEDKHDFSADSKNGRVIVNLAKIGKTQDNPNPDIFMQITTAKGILAHEIFHIIIQMLKPAEVADERMVIDLSDGNTISSRGMVGFMINEGFVEKFSTELCERFGLYYAIGPQYIPYINICNYLMEINPNINSKTIFSLDETDCIGSLSEDEQQKYYDAEAISFAVRHAGKKAEDVVGSYIEKVDIDFNNIPQNRLEELKVYYEQKNNKLNETMQIDSSFHL